MTFHTFSTFESLVSNRLYVSEYDQSAIEQTVLAPRKGLPYERRGLGLTQYNSLIGPILRVVGVAFKSRNEYGEVIYLNKSSFSHLILRMKESISSTAVKNGVVVSNIDIAKVNRLYEKKLIDRASIKTHNQILDQADSNKSIYQLMHNFLNLK